MSGVRTKAYEDAVMLISGNAEELARNTVRLADAVRDAIPHVDVSGFSSLPDARRYLDILLGVDHLPPSVRNVLTNRKFNANAVLEDPLVTSQ